MVLHRQKNTEFSRLLRLIGEYGCKTFLEIGSATGDSFLSIGCSMQRAISVDLPNSKWGSKNTHKRLQQRVRDMREKLNVDARLFLGDSKDTSIIEQVEELGPYDLVFIDGDHTAEGVRSDWEKYGKLGRKLVAFHDILGEKMPTVGVWELWQELKKEHNYVEFCETWGRTPMGIGVIIVE